MDRYALPEIARTRQKVVDLARAILAGEIGVLEGSMRMLEYRFSAGVPEFDEDFLTFVAIDSAEDHLPVGSVRQFWHPAALARADLEIADAERFHRAAAFRAADSLIRRFTSDVAQD